MDHSIHPCRKKLSFIKSIYCIKIVSLKEHSKVISEAALSIATAYVYHNYIHYQAIFSPHPQPVSITENTDKMPP